MDSELSSLCCLPSQYDTFFFFFVNEVSRGVAFLQFPEMLLGISDLGLPLNEDRNEKII